MTNQYIHNAASQANLSFNDILRKHWQWLLGLGIALIILGTVSILAAALTTLISIISFGVFLMINGSMLLYQALKVWWKKWNRFFFQLSMGILYVLAGAVLIFYPIHGAMSLTLMLAFFYIVLGFYRGVLAVVDKIPGWGWMLLSSFITVLLGIYILTQWPAISLWIIGIFVGVDILFVGWAFVMSALSVQEKTEKAA